MSSRCAAGSWTSILRAARGPVRLDLFGDVLDSARRFDPESQRTTEKIARVELAPVSEVILDEAAIQRFRTA